MYSNNKHGIRRTEWRWYNRKPVEVHLRLPSSFLAFHCVLMPVISTHIHANRQNNVNVLHRFPCISSRSYKLTSNLMRWLVSPPSCCFCWLNSARWRTKWNSPRPTVSSGSPSSVCLAFILLYSQRSVFQVSQSRQWPLWQPSSQCRCSTITLNTCSPHSRTMSTSANIGPTDSGMNSIE